MNVSPDDGNGLITELMDTGADEPLIDIASLDYTQNGNSLFFQTDCFRSRKRTFTSAEEEELVVKKRDEVSMEDNVEDITDEFRASGIIVHTIENVSKVKDCLGEQILSDPVMIRNLPWKILAISRNPHMHGLGIFVQCNAESPSTTWSIHVAAEISLIHPTDPSLTLSKKITHTFHAKENDWGYSNFITWADIADKGFIKDDSITIEIRVTGDLPHGVSWDSKKYTGYVGLKNQGATCYMNSLLQTLFFTNKLRKAVYMMPTESDDSTKSVALALQRIFWDLQFSDKSVATKKLTKSFGWETLDSFMQHDVQELCRVLLDNVESKMKGTIVDNTIPNLFQGKMESFFRCLNVDYKSSTTEPFYDLQLGVVGVKDIYASLKDYVKLVMLDGDNKYDAGEWGLQDAEKGTRFLEFPPVLHLHLLRLQYDAATDSDFKINDRFEFPESLNVSEFTPSEEECIYRLHSVLVHAGDNHGGHYVAYISPEVDGKWFRFDDEVVSKCTRKEAVQMNFGGGEDDILFRHCSSAYMLVYLKESSLDDILCKVDENDIPHSLRERFEEEHRLEVQRRKERMEVHLYMPLILITEDMFYQHDGLDLVDMKRRDFIEFRVKRTLPMTQLVDAVAEYMKFPPSCVRLWNMRARENTSIRPAYIEFSNKHIERVFTDKLEVDVITLLVETSLQPLPPFSNEESLLLFCKHYCPRTQTLAYCGHFFIARDECSSKILPILCDLVGLPPDTDLLLYEEVRPGRIEPISDLNHPVCSLVEDIMTGDIIVFQKKETHLADLSLFSPVAYANEFRDRIRVTFVEKSRHSADEGFSVFLFQQAGYDELASACASHLGVERSMLQFYRNRGDGPGVAIKFSQGGTLRNLVLSLVGARQKTFHEIKIYYMVLNIPITEMEHRRIVRCILLDRKLEERDLLLYPPKEARVQDLILEASAQLDCDVHHLRVVDVIHSRVQKIHPEDALLPETSLCAGKTSRIEIIPEDQMSVRPGEMLVPVAHFCKEVCQCFGTPFLIKISEDTTPSTLVQSLQRLLSVTGKEFSNYKVWLIKEQRRVTMLWSAEFQVDYEQDVCQLVPDASAKKLSLQDFIPKPGLEWHLQPWIGIDHPQRLPKRTRQQFYLEKAIKIHN